MRCQHENVEQSYYEYLDIDGSIERKYPVSLCADCGEEVEPSEPDWDLIAKKLEVK